MNVISSLPWYKLVISLSSVYTALTQPRGLWLSVCKSHIIDLHLVIKPIQTIQNLEKN